MQLACPNCGTREVRVSYRSGFLEWIKGLFGIYPLRCRRCRHRWLTSAWAGGAWKYARCPRCYRQELTTWSEHYYHPPRTVVLMLRMGATPYRCAACRCNFASFKSCKEKFSWRHETKVDTRKPAPRFEEPPAEAPVAPVPDLNGTAHLSPIRPEPVNVAGVHEPDQAVEEPQPADEYSEPYL